MATDATKLEVKKAVEQLFKVKVDVQTLKVKGKVKRNRNGSASAAELEEKPYVKLEQGQDIDFVAAE